MIGLGPHTMTVGDWIFIAVLQLSLVLFAVLALWWAVRATRPRSGR